MLTVTENAGARLTELLGESADDTVVRVVRRKRRLKLRRDRVRANDAQFSHDGRVVLVLDEQISKRLSSRTLHVRQTKDGPRLSLKTR